MNRYQRAKRYAYLRGLFIAIAAFTAYIFALGLADRITNG